MYVLRYEDGLLATGFDDGFPWTRDWSEAYRIEGLDGIARGDIGWPTGGFSTLEFTTRDRPDTWLRPAFSRKWFPDAFLATMGELFLAIEEDREPSISGRDNLRRCDSSKPATCPPPSDGPSAWMRSRWSRQTGHLSYTDRGFGVSQAERA